MDKEAEQVWDNAFGDIAWARDVCDAIIRKNRHGKTGSLHGWTVDHIDPNGGNALRNKQPLHWRNNIAKSNKTKWKCAVKALKANDGKWHNYDLENDCWLNAD